VLHEIQNDDPKLFHLNMELTLTYGCWIKPSM